MLREIFTTNFTENNGQQQLYDCNFLSTCKSRRLIEGNGIAKKTDSELGCPALMGADVQFIQGVLLQIVTI